MHPRVGKGIVTVYQRNFAKPMSSIIILAGGRSSRLGRDKGLASLVDKTLVEHVWDRVEGLAEEIVVVVSSRKQQEAYSRILKGHVVADRGRCGGPLTGLRSGLKVIKAQRVAVIGCDMPFVSADLLDLFFEFCLKQDAVVPRWPDGYIEPLHSVYDSTRCLMATESALRKGRRDMRSMIYHLHRVLYVSTEVIRKMGPHLEAFTNINTRAELWKARHALANGNLLQDEHQSVVLHTATHSKHLTHSPAQSRHLS